jgi:hypothetical protein
MSYFGHKKISYDKVIVDTIEGIFPAPFYLYRA